MMCKVVQDVPRAQCISCASMPSAVFPSLSPCICSHPQEREAVMCKVVEDVLRGALPQAGLLAAPTSAAMVVGSGHLPGG